MGVQSNKLAGLRKIGQICPENGWLQIGSHGFRRYKLNILKKLIKPIVVPILNLNYQMKKKLYFRTRINNILKTLKNENITDINKFNEKNWHHGYCYFTGVYNNKKVFIKVDTKLKMLKNEQTFYEMMKDKISNYLTPIEFFYEDKQLQFVVYEFLSEYSELNEELLSKNINYLDDIYNILKAMKENKVIHRDIKLNNFMVNKNHIKIIDFTFSYSLNKKSNFKELDISEKQNILILNALGVGLNPKPFQWNDSMSMIKVLENITILTTENKLKLYLEKLIVLSSNNTYTLNLEIKK